MAPGDYKVVWTDGTTVDNLVVGKCKPTIATFANPSTGTVGVAMNGG